MNQTTKPQRSDWEIAYKGKIIALETIKSKGFERAIRPAGVRMILVNEKGEILITKEYRHEQDKIDYRLPGGKVFDSLDDYLAIRGDNDAELEAATYAVKIEAKQEAGIDEIKDLELIEKLPDGATVEWDLYYFRGKVGSLTDQSLEGDEAKHGIEVGFYTVDEILKLLDEGKVSEGRSAGILYRELRRL